MTIINQYLLIAFVFTVGYMVVVFQAVGLRWALRSSAWTFLASAFVLSGLRLVWGLVRLPELIMQAQIKGRTPESLTPEQWMQIGVAGIVLILLIVGFHKLRQDLRKIGVK